MILYTRSYSTVNDFLEFNRQFIHCLLTPQLISQIVPRCTNRSIIAFYGRKPGTVVSEGFTVIYLSLLRLWLLPQ